MPRSASEFPKDHSELPRVRIPGVMKDTNYAGLEVITVLDHRLHVPVAGDGEVRGGGVIAYNQARTLAWAKDNGVPLREEIKRYDVFDDPFQYLGTLELVAARKRRDAVSLERMEGELEDLLPLTWLLQAGYANVENPFVSGLREVSASPLLKQPLDERLRGAARFVREGQHRIDKSGQLNDGRLPLYVWPAINRLANRRHGDLAIALAFNERALAMGFMIESHMNQMRLHRRVALQALQSAPTIGAKRTEERRHLVADRWVTYANECEAVVLRPFCHAMGRVAHDYRWAAQALRDDSISFACQRLDVIARSMLLITRYRTFLFRLRVAIAQVEMYYGEGELRDDHRQSLYGKLHTFVEELERTTPTEFGSDCRLDVGFENPVVNKIIKDVNEARSVLYCGDRRLIHRLKKMIDDASAHF